MKINKKKDKLLIVVLNLKLAILMELQLLQNLKEIQLLESLLQEIVKYPLNNHLQLNHQYKFLHQKVNNNLEPNHFNNQQKVLMKRKYMKKENLINLIDLNQI